MNAIDEMEATETVESGSGTVRVDVVTWEGPTGWHTLVRWGGGLTSQRLEGYEPDGAFPTEFEARRAGRSRAGFGLIRLAEIDGRAERTDSRGPTP